MGRGLQKGYSKDTGMEACECVREGQTATGVLQEFKNGGAVRKGSWGWTVMRLNRGV